MNRRRFFLVASFGAAAVAVAAPAQAGVYVSASYGYASYAPPVIVSPPVYVAPAPVIVSEPVYVAPAPVVVHRTYYAPVYPRVVYHRPVRIVRHYYRPHRFGFRFGFHHH